MDFKVGDRCLYVTHDFDGTSKVECTITSVGNTYCIAESDDGMKLWIADFNKDDFKVIRRETHD